MTKGKHSWFIESIKRQKSQVFAKQQPWNTFKKFQSKDTLQGKLTRQNLEKY